MRLETKRQRLLYQGLVPIAAAIIGAISATWFQSTSIDQAQLNDVISLIGDPKLSSEQKLQALELYREITDRPWAIIRSLVTAFTMTLSVVVGALVFGGYFNKK